MGCSMWVRLMTSLVVLGLLKTSPATGLSCGDAVSAMVPCSSFLLGGAARPTAQCCSRVAGLNKQAKDTPSRKSLCQCFKQSGPSYGVKPEKAKQLPALCKITLSVPISPDVDCSRVH